MDRTMIGPHKAEEKELSEKLYKKLQGLTLLNSQLITEDFRKCLTKDMFLKPNPIAFFQVMHFLFRLHDPLEFKKRFFWPVTDKRAESAFRTSTVEYLKFLSDKHNLNWNIKSYLVVKPFGMKFIIFLLDLVGFIIQVQVRLREKHLGIESPLAREVCMANLNGIRKQNEFHKEFASQYMAEIDAQNLVFREKIEMLKQKIHDLEAIFPNCSINKEFIGAFNAANKKLFKEKYAKHAQNIESLSKPLNELREGIEKFQNKATEVKRDKSDVKDGLRKIMSTVESPELEETLGSQLESADGPSINSLIEAFVMVAPKMNNWMKNVIENSSTTKDGATSALLELKNEFLQLEKQIDDFQKKLNVAKIKQRQSTLSTTVAASNSPFNFKFVQTPPIKLNANTESFCTRLPLQDETMEQLESSTSYFALMNNNNTVLDKFKIESDGDQSFDLNNTMNCSKLDPKQLLRTIHKNSVEKSEKTQKHQLQQRQNLSLLGIKWKERQQMFEKETPTTSDSDKLPKPTKLMDAIELNEQASTSALMMKSPKTPFNTTSSDITQVAAFSRVSENSPSSNLLKKPPTIQKVQDTSLNIQNLSTSPSGRLEPLVPLEPTLEESEKFAAETSNSLDIEIASNNLKIPIVPKFVFDSDDDSIFNTSSTVLTDI